MNNTQASKKKQKKEPYTRNQIIGIIAIVILLFPLLVNIFGFISVPIAFLLHVIFVPDSAMDSNYFYWSKIWNKWIIKISALFMHQKKRPFAVRFDINQSSMMKAERISIRNLLINSLMRLNMIFKMKERNFSIYPPKNGRI